MKVVARDIWLCEDCMVAAVNDDYSGLDYSYSPIVAHEVMCEIKAGLAELGPNLVPDFGDSDRHECRECGFAAHFDEFEQRPIAHDESVLICTKCGHDDVLLRGDGERELSNYRCACCNSNTAGRRFRFAQLGND